MARSLLSLALLACLSLALLELVSAEQQNQELEAVLNQAVQVKPEDVQVRILREADAKKKKSKRRPRQGKKRPRGKGGNKRSRGKGGKKRPRSRGKGSKKRPRSRGKGGKKRPRSRGKGGKKRPRSRGKGGKKNPRSKGKGSKKRPKPNQVKQAAACNVTSLCQQIKNYIKYSNQLRKVKRIGKTCSTMEKKAAKAGEGEFNASAEANTDTDDANVTAIANGLKNCTATVKTNCATKAVKGCIDTAGNAKCQKALEDWIAKFGPAKGSCLQKEADCCACINGISPAPPKECLSFDAIDVSSKKKKKGCTGSDTKGSFGYCRKLQMSAAEKGPAAAKKKCKGMTGGTTAGAGGRRMVFRNSLLKKWIKA